jgi:hypothetical protein
VGGFYYQSKEDFMTALVQEQDQIMHTNGAALPHLANLPFNFSQNVCREFKTQQSGQKQTKG